MAFITNDWTIQEYAGNFITPVGKPLTLAALGIDNAEYELLNLAEDVLTFTAGGRAIDAGLLWPYGTTLGLFDPFGVRQFFGRVEPWTVQAVGGEQNHMGRLVNPFWYFRKIYQQTYSIAATRDLEGNPLTFKTYFTPRVVLNILFKQPNGFFSATTGQQIADAVNWAITNGAPIKLGTVDPASTPISDFQKGIPVTEVIKKMFRVEPDFVIDWDYSTLPFPTIHFRKMQSLVPLIVDIADTIIRDRLTIKARPDWQRSYVNIVYDETDTQGQQTYLAIMSDLYPNPAPAGVEAQFQGVDLYADLQGSKVNQTSESAILQSSLFDVTTLTSWRNWCPELADTTNCINPVILTATSVPPAASAPDQTAGYNAPTILAHDENDPDGNPVAYNPHLIYEQADGHLPDWLSAAPFNIAFQKVRVTAWVKYTTPQNETHYKFVHHDFTAVQRNTLGIATTFIETTSTTTAFAEEPPIGLAQQMWTSWQNLTIEGGLRNVEYIIGQSGKISRSNTLVFKNGALATPDYVGKVALIQNIKGNIAQGTTSVEFGAPLHITGHELIDLIRATRMRVTTIDLGYLFGGALGGGGGGTVQHPHKSPSRHSHAGAPQAFKITLRVKQDNGDYYSCVTWNGVTEGTATFLVAKIPALRVSLASINLNDGSVETYTYAKSVGPNAMNWWTRTFNNNVAAAPNATGTEIVTPDLVFDSEIIAESIEPLSLVTSPTDNTLIKLTLIDTSQRHWGRIT